MIVVRVTRRWTFNDAIVSMRMLFVVIVVTLPTETEIYDLNRMVVDKDVDVDDLFADLENMVCQQIQIYLTHCMELRVLNEGQVLRNFLH